MCPHCDLRWWLNMAGAFTARFTPSPTKHYPHGTEARIGGSFAKWYPCKPITCTCNWEEPPMKLFIRAARKEGAA